LCLCSIRKPGRHYCSAQPKGEIVSILTKNDHIKIFLNIIKIGAGLDLKNFILFAQPTTMKELKNYFLNFINCSSNFMNPPNFHTKKIELNNGI